MEIVQMVALGNLLSGSPGDDPGEVIDVDVDDEE